METMRQQRVRWNSDAECIEGSRQASPRRQVSPFAAANEAEVDKTGDAINMKTTATLSGAGGQHLARELAAWWKDRSVTDSIKPLPKNAWERVELNVKTYYDRPIGAVLNVVYDVLQLSSGRDKFCAILQNYAKIASAAFSAPDSDRYWMFRSIEDSLSEGRKIFRFFKEYREIYKVRRGFHRMQLGIAEHGLGSVPMICGTLDVFAHLSSFFFYLFDNLLWAASVGIVGSAEGPIWQIKMWRGRRRDGAVMSLLGGAANIKRRKDLASIFRIVFAFIANVLLLRKAIRDCEGEAFRGPDDPRLYHTLELCGMAASFRDLLARLDVAPMKSQVNIGLLGIVGATCGLWSNWRKVTADQCGTKQFVTVAERRALSEGDLSRFAP
eukprot:TRINITY_DN45698_c0_g1_i1.p1 TRINITY_DN45698_c0_g1~~TRINITY_DN45698_c0_g1_i1.p1  ORF type:complete len:401 (+),score=63.45 TRINITY_DN45698_c0_g1_i1:56-1204(+)